MEVVPSVDKRERDTRACGGVRARDLAFGLHQPGEAGRRDPERLSHPVAEHGGAGVDLRRRRAGSSGEIRCRGTPVAPAPATVPLRRRHRCSRTPPWGCVVWRCGADPRSSVRLSSRRCFKFSCGLRNCSSGASSWGRGRRRFIVTALSPRPRPTPAAGLSRRSSMARPMSCNNTGFRDTRSSMCIPIDLQHGHFVERIGRRGDGFECQRGLTQKVA